MSSYDYDVCVIGAGSAGLVCAAGAVQLGARVALVERDRMGGECLNTGCVPSKALLRSAELAALMRRSGEFGLPPVTHAADIGTVMTHVANVIREIAPHDSVERFRDLGVEVIAGHASFTGPHTLAVSGREIRARWVVLATGSDPVVPPVPGIGTLPLLTNENIFSLREPVPRLVVLGAGAVGLELAQAFSRLGSAVTVVEAAARILPHEDAEAVTVLRQSLEAEGIRILCGVRVERAEKSAAGVNLRVFVNDHALEIPGSHLLVAAGRRPRLNGLDLQAAGVKFSGGELPVDRRLRTNQKHIYACGDVVGPYRFTHMAEHQAGVVLRNMIFHLPTRTENRVVPWCTFTDPEVAQVGLSESRAVESRHYHEVFRMPFTAVDRAITDHRTAGFVKVIAGRRGRLLGTTIVGAHAGELIHEYALALRHGLRLADISACIHAYPSYSQANRFAADERIKRRLTPTARRWIQRVFQLQGAT